MGHQVTTQGTWTLIRVDGRLDGQTSPQLESMAKGLLDHHATDLAMDLTLAGFLSSAGLRVFNTLFRECTHRGKRFVLVGPDEAIREILDISGFSTMLIILPTEADLPA